MNDTVEVPIEDLKPDPANPRRITEFAMNRLKKSVSEDPDFLRLRPILARTDGTIYGGNMRYEAAKALGMNTVPVIYDDSPEALVRARAIKDNGVFGEWVPEELGQYIADLRELDPTADLEALGLDLNTVRTLGLEAEYGLEALEAMADDPAERARQRAEEATSGGQGPGGARPDFTKDDGTLADVPGEKAGAFQLTDNLNVDDPTNFWGIPELRQDMLVDELPQPMKTWSDQKTTPPEDGMHYLWNYGLAPFAGIPPERTLLCFYTWDHHFENWWSLPAYYTTKVLNAGVRMAVVPDFSMYGDAPKVLLLMQVFRAQWMGRYFQEAGIKVIPRINFGDTDSYDFSFLGIPEGVPVAATCFQTFFTKMVEQSEYTPETRRQYAKDGFRAALDAIKPQSLLNYGGPPARRFVDECLLEWGERIPVMHLPNYVEVRRHVAFDKGAAHTDTVRDDNPNVENPGARLAMPGDQGVSSGLVSRSR